MEGGEPRGRLSRGECGDCLGCRWERRGVAEVEGCGKSLACALRLVTNDWVALKRVLRDMSACFEQEAAMDGTATTW
jgi:hypothetical protein